MRYIALGLVILCGSICAPHFFVHAQVARAAIATSDPDFSIVVFPDTQYYQGQNAYVFKDQANWVVSHQAALNIKAVIGMGDIIDGGGYPIDANGTVSGTCVNAPSSTWQTQWQQARAAVNILNAHGIYYQPTIGNHDYDCEADRPQPRAFGWLGGER